jgi:hypothetical protein
LSAVKHTRARLILLLHALASAAGGGALRAQNAAQWDFDGSLGSSTGHAALAAAAAAPAAAPSVGFEEASIAGRPAQVARFSRGTYFRVHPGFAANGGGAYVNQFTVIADVMFPDRSPSGGWAALLQTNDANANDADWFIHPAGGLGAGGVYRGSVPEGEWHRLALVVDLVEGALTSYIDGAKAGTIAGQARDGRFSLYSTSDGAREGFLLFADDDGENAGGLIDALQVRNAALCPEDIAAFGGVSSGPLAPAPLPPKLCAPEPPPPLALKEGPYLQWATETEMTVMWETTVPADGAVLYHRSGGPWLEAADARVRRIHELRLSGFSPQETVAYRVRSRRGDEEALSEVSTFTTSPAEPIPFSFVIWGDNHVNPPVFGALVQSMAAQSPQLGIGCGDVVDDGNVYEEWGEGLLTPLQPLAQSVPFYIAIGNHEANARWFYEYLAQPGNEHWFAFDYAGCRFVIIDTNFPFGPSSEQYEWLRSELFSDAARSARWLFTFHHHPPYSEIYEEVIYAQIRMHLVPLYEAAGVDINFTGHIHDYERGIYTPPDTGRRIVYLQTSGAGGRLWDDEFDGDHEQIDKVIQYVHHYCEASIEGDSLSFRAIALDGETIDSFSLRRLPRSGEPPPPPPPPPPGGRAVTQWDFDGGGLSASFGPGRLEFLDGGVGATAARTEFGSTAELGIPGIQGRPSGVVKFPKATLPSLGFRVAPAAPPNGGGIYVNEYTLVFDLYLPASSFAGDAWLAFFNTNTENANDADLFARLDSGGIGISGEYAGKLSAGAWHRIAAVFRREAGGMALDKFIDGVYVGSQSIGQVDGRWSLYAEGAAQPWFLLFTDNDGESSSGYVSSFLFADRALGAAEVAGLGKADADGIAAGPCDVASCDAAFRRGDANGDGRADVSDVVFALLHLFTAAAPSPCDKALDVDDDGAVAITDPVYALDFLFRGGPAIEPPFPGCGEDPTVDALVCELPGPCG